jgi:hypothetical protein
VFTLLILLVTVYRYQFAIPKLCFTANRGLGMRHRVVGIVKSWSQASGKQTPTGLPYLGRAGRRHGDLAVLDWLTVADCLQIFDNSASSPGIRIGIEQAFVEVAYWMPYPLAFNCPTRGKTYDYSDAEGKFWQKELSPPPPGYSNRLAPPSVQNKFISKEN